MITINPEKLVRNVSRSGELIFRGGLALQAELGTQNVERFTRFLQTPQGKTFTLQQVILQSQNPKSGTRIYNPAAPIIAKQLGQEFTKQKPKRHLDIGDGSLRGIFRGIIGRSQPRTQKENAVRFFDKKLNKEIDLQVSYGGSKFNDKIFPTRESNAGGDGFQDFIKFRIRDAVNGKYIIFPALISGITDNSSNNTTSFNYIGRADKVYVYQDYSRSISFTVQIVAQREEDIPIIWEKINYAKGLTLPKYEKFISKGGVEDNTRPVAPIVYLTLGDMFNNAPGFFTSVNLSIPENSTWELEEGLQVPHLCTLAFEFTYIGKETPENRVGAKHYDNISDSFTAEEEDDKNDPTRAQVRRSQRKKRNERFRQNRRELGGRRARQLRRQRRRSDRQQRQEQFG